MKILIAESKTMTDCATPVDAAVYSRHHPAFNSVSTILMKGWSSWKAEDISSAIKVSPALAAQFLRMTYEFPNKSTGEKALPAFTGVVFKALDYASLTPEEKIRAEKDVIILSSVYGLLRGDDIVKPYRLEYSTRMAPTGETMASYWKRMVTPEILDDMKARGETEILDLLPADAAKCVDWRWVKGRCRVVKAEFRSVLDGGTLKTPHSTLLKTLRGRLLREIIRHDIRSIDALMRHEADWMYVDPEANVDSGELTIFVSSVG